MRFEDSDLADYIEQVTKRYMIRTQSNQYVNVNRGEFVREGLGKLSFDLRGHITSEASLDALRKIFLEDSTDYKKFYYPNDDKFWKVKTKRFDVEERGGILNYYPVSIRLETLDQFQYAESTTITTGSVVATDPHLALDGSTSYVKVINSSELNPSTLTAQGYFKLSEIAQTYLIDKYETAGTSGYLLSITSAGKLSFYLTDGDTSVSAVGTSVVCDGSWHHLAGVWDGGSVYAYVDGSEETATAWGGTLGTNTQDLYLGARGPSLNYVLDGSMDEIRISEDRTVGELGSKPFSADAKTISLWHFDDASGTVASDSGTYNNDASIIDCVWYAGTAVGLSLDMDIVNDGNIWCKPELRVIAVGGNLASPSFGNNNGATITWEGTISQGGTLFIYPDRTARVGGVWYSGLLEGTYPKVEVLDGGTETWTYSHPAQTCTDATVSIIHRDRWW